MESAPDSPNTKEAKAATSKYSFSVTIPTVVTHENYTGFLIVVQDSTGAEWEVEHRFSEFHTLNEKLCRSYPIVEKFQFPPKKMLNQGDKMIEKRRHALEIWLYQVISDVNLISNYLVRDFIEIKDDDSPVEDKRLKNVDSLRRLSSISSLLTTTSSDAAGISLINDCDAEVSKLLLSMVCSRVEEGKPDPYSPARLALRGQVTDKLKPEVFEIVRQQKITSLKSGSFPVKPTTYPAVIVHTIASGKGHSSKIKVKLSEGGTELRYGLYNPADEEEILPYSVRTHTLVDLSAGSQCPGVANLKKATFDKATCVALVSKRAKPAENDPIIESLFQGVIIPVVDDFVDYCDGLRALIGKPLRQSASILQVATLTFTLVESHFLLPSAEEVETANEGAPEIPDMPSGPFASEPCPVEADEFRNKRRENASEPLELFSDDDTAESTWAPTPLKVCARS